MKKSFLLVVLIVFAGNLLLAQRPKCLNDVEYALVSLKEVPRAKKYIDECFPGNESSADVWLVRANVYIQLFEYEIERNKKEPKYVIRWPEAIVIANESFYKALELRPDVKPAKGLIDAKDGQLLTAPVIHDMAANAMDKKDYIEAVKFLNLVIRSYKADPKKYAINLAVAYLDLSNCYKSLGDEVNEKKLLIDASKLNLAVPEIYLNLYDIYAKEKDTVKCGEILNQARKVLPDSLSTNVKSYELDFFAMTRDTAKLKSAAIKMYEQFKDNPAVINIVVGHLINNKEYLLAEDMIKNGLVVDPNDFDLNQQMGYRFNCEALDYIEIASEKSKEKFKENPNKYTEIEAAQKKSKEIFEIARNWVEKAYQLNPNDRDNNIMYSRILVRLNIEVPQELKEKVDSYYKRSE
jgi:tetratricopeptide (TPR) repeat protein